MTADAIWSALKYVTSPLTFGAFIYAAYEVRQWQTLKRDVQLVEALPEDRRAEAVEKLIDRRGIRRGDVTRKDYNKLADRELRQKPFFAFLAFLFGIACLVASVISFNTSNKGPKPEFPPVAPPSKQTILGYLNAAKVTKEQVLAPAPANGERVFTVTSKAGKDFSIWAYDCYWCFNEIDPNDTSKTVYMDLLRFIDTEIGSKKEFKDFGKLDSKSGYFALFIEYPDYKEGKDKRQFIGVENLFVPPDRRLEIGVREDTGDGPLNPTFTH